MVRSFGDQTWPCCQPDDHQSLVQPASWDNQCPWSWRGVDLWDWWDWQQSCRRPEGGCYGKTETGAAVSTMKWELREHHGHSDSVCWWLINPTRCDSQRPSIPSKMETRQPCKCIVSNHHYSHFNYMLTCSTALVIWKRVGPMGSLALNGSKNLIGTPKTRQMGITVCCLLMATIPITC